MVKHAARRKAQGLHKLLLEKEKANLERLAKKREKTQERMREQAALKAGSDGNVQALESVKFTGTFGVNFDNVAAAGKDEDMTLDEVEVDGQLMKSTRKKDATRISKQNYLIKKKAKKERKKIKRAEKTGRIIKRMQDK